MCLNPQSHPMERPVETQAAIAQYIQKELAIGRKKPIAPDEDLFATGVLDSLGVLQLVLFLEEQFGIKVADEEVVLENFQSLNSMADYIDRKNAARV
jgi:acyl carrier protein